MEMHYEMKEAMTFIGFHTEIRPDEGSEKCPAFWEKEYSARFARLWQTMQPEDALEEAVLRNGIGMFAVCEDGADSFRYWIAGLYQGGDVPEGLHLIGFPAGEWAVFSAKGPLPGSLQTLNTAVWQEWYPAEREKFADGGMKMLEVYTPGDMQSPDYRCGIWVPVTRK